jgi:protein O-GlcNAc transferase
MLTVAGAEELLREAKASLVRGDSQEAGAICARLLSTSPICGPALRMLGMALACQGDLVGAVSRLESALATPGAPAAWLRDLASAYAGAGAWHKAVDAFERFFRNAAADADVLAQYARALVEWGRREDAVDACRRAATLHPGKGATWRSLARVFERLRMPQDAFACAESALVMEPESADTQELAARICTQFKRYDDAYRYAVQAVHVAPENVTTLAALGFASVNTGRVGLGRRILRDAASRGASPEVESAALAAGLHHAGLSAAAQLAEARAWYERHCGRIPRFDHQACGEDPDRALRIGYLGGEFSGVPSHYFLAPLLAKHDRRAFAVYCYDSRGLSDQTTASMLALADCWRDVSGDSDDRVADLIRSDRIDILVDASGHYPFNRLPVFARRPAPVQVLFPCYPGPTGVAEFDYVLTDEWTTPAGTEIQYAERVWRLPAGHIAYAPPAAPQVNRLPALANGYITFALLQRGPKLNSGVWDAVARVMRLLPGSRLLVHQASADLGSRASVSSRRILRALGRRGISAKRVILRGTCDLPQHLELVASTDIALDAFPYSGQTTSLACVWMGVPVVTMYVDTHPGRVCGGLLRRLGLDGCVASSTDEYVAIATRLAGDLDGLAALRDVLRGRVSRSTLMDRSVIRGMEAAYREMWRIWCRKAACAPAAMHS